MSNVRYANYAEDRNRIFEPITINGVELPNRIVLPPMGSNYASADGQMTDEHLAYYRQRARGGVGLIIVENVCVDYPVASNGFTQLRMDNDIFLPRFFTFTEEMHRYGAKVSIQLNHAGASADPKKTGVQNVSSSAVVSKVGMPVPVAMDHEQIQHAIKAFGLTAKRAQRAGFDMVEIHGGHSYLIDQFLSPIMNKRTDEYGGSIENRARFAREVLAEVRAQVGPRFPIGIRLSADELWEGGNTLEDTLKLAEYFDEYVDLYNVSAAINQSLQYQIDKPTLDDGWRSFMAREYKDKFNKPVMTSGNIRNPQKAQDILERGDADLLAIGRGLIADPWWARKVRHGKENEILECISCNIGCADNRIRLGHPLRCSINPDIINHEEYKTRQVTVPTKVVVVGGGVGGLEAAATAAEVGADVVLFEARDHLGGVVADATNLPAKWRIANYVKRHEDRARRAGVDIRLSTYATAEAVESERPDVIVNATGSSPAVPPIPGLRDNLERSDSNVYTINSFLEKIEEIDSTLQGKHVVVVGAGAVGLDVVEHLSETTGATVTLIERLPGVGIDLDMITRLQMVEVLEKFEVTQLISTELLEIGSGYVQIRAEGEEPRRLECAGTVVCLGMKAVQSELPDLVDLGMKIGAPVLNIGDSVSARRIIDAVREGRDVLKVLEDIGKFDVLARV